MISGRGLHLSAVCTGITVLLGSLLFVDLPTAGKIPILFICLLLAVVGGPVAGASIVAVALSVSAFTVIVGSSEWSPLELALIACGLSVVLQIGREFVRNTDPRVFLRWISPRDVAFLAAALVILGAVSLLWVADSDLRPDSLRSLRRVIIEPVAIVPALAFVVREGRVRLLVHWLAWPAVAVSALTLVQLIIQRSTVDIGGLNRPIGTFTHPNNLAFYLERVLWFVLLLAVWLRPGLGRWAWLFAGMALAATLVTFSRGAAVALAAGSVVMFWDVLRVRLRLFAGLVAAATVAVFASRLLAESGDSVDTRTDVWRSSIAMIQDHPFTGVGLDQFLGQYGRRYVRPDGWPERYTSHPHNVLLDFWLSLGIGGLAVLWLLLEATWRRVKHALSTPAWSINRAATAMLVAGLAHGLIDNSFFLAYLATLTWVGLTLGLATDKKAFND